MNCIWPPVLILMSIFVKFIHVSMWHLLRNINQMRTFCQTGRSWQTGALSFWSYVSPRLLQLSSQRSCLWMMLRSRCTAGQNKGVAGWFAGHSYFSSPDNPQVSTVSKNEQQTPHLAEVSAAPTKKRKFSFWKVWSYLEMKKQIFMTHCAQSWLMSNKHRQARKIFDTLVRICPLLNLSGSRVCLCGWWLRNEAAFHSLSEPCSVLCPQLQQGNQESCKGGVTLVIRPARLRHLFCMMLLDPPQPGWVTQHGHLMGQLSIHWGPSQEWQVPEARRPEKG